MKTEMRAFRKIANVTLGIGMGLGAFGMASVHAEEYPARRITIVVPFAPGGIIDFMGRAVGEQLQRRWSQPVVVENKPGGNGAIGANTVMQAPADGHVLYAAANSLVSTPLFVKAASFNLERDLDPVAAMFYAPFVIITNSQVPAKNLREFINHAKANPGKLNFAVTSASSQLLDTLDFMARAGIAMQTVSYKSGSDSLRAVLANEAQAYLGAVFGLEEQVKAGRIVALAVTSAKPYPRLPGVPTVASAAGFDFDTGVLYGFFATKGTPKHTIDRLAAAIGDIALNSDVTARLKAQGYEPIAMGPAAFAEALAREARRAAVVARNAGIKPE